MTGRVPAPGPGNSTPGAPGKSAKQSAIDAGLIPANSTDAQYQAYLRGAAGPAGPNPTIVTGLSGGTPGNFLLKTLGAQTCFDAHPSMILALRTQPLYWLHLDGVTYYKLPAILPGLMGLTPGQAVCLSGKTSATGRNWATFNLADGIPLLYDMTNTQMYVLLGFVGSTTTIEADGALGSRNYDGSTGTTVFDNFDAWPTGAMTTPYTQQWAADATSNPNGLYVEQISGGTSGDLQMVEHPAAVAEHMVVRKPFNSGNAFLDGQVYSQTRLEADGGLQFDTLVGGRITGAAGSENGVGAWVLDGNNVNTLYLVQFVNGVKTTLGSVALGAALGGGTLYSTVFDYKGSRLQAKTWLTSGAEPAGWMVEAYTGYLTAGYAGVGTRSNQYLIHRALGLSAGPAAAPRA